MHKESALRGVPDSQRCSGWKTGICEPEEERVKQACPHCGLLCEGESQAMLDDMIRKHIQEKSCDMGSD